MNQRQFNLLKKQYPFDTFRIKNERLNSFGINLPVGDVFCLCELLESNSCKVAVEIGAWTGRTTCIIADYVKSKSGQLFTIDNFRGTGSDANNYAFNVKEILVDNLIRFDVQDVTTILDGESDEFISMFEDESIDFMFIDGDHRYTQFKKDFDSWYPKIKIGGMFSGHDFNGCKYEEEHIEDDIFKGVHHGVAKVVKEYCLKGLPIKCFETERRSSIWWLIKQTSGLPDSHSKQGGTENEQRKTKEETGILESIGSAELKR